MANIPSTPSTPGSAQPYAIPVGEAVFLTFRASNDLLMPDGNRYSMWLHVILDPATGRIHALEAQYDPAVCQTIGIQVADAENRGGFRPEYVITRPCNAPFRVRFEDPEVTFMPSNLQKKAS